MKSLLILTRRVGEEISINDGEIIVRVLSVKNGQVRLGFTASDEVKIKRKPLTPKKVKKV